MLEQNGSDGAAEVWWIGSGGSCLESASGSGPDERLMLVTTGAGEWT